MGIRFACHICHKQLNVKRELAGRRGICPACQSRFRIPDQDAEQSIPVDDAANRSGDTDQPNPTDRTDTDRTDTDRPDEGHPTDQAERPDQTGPTTKVFGEAIDVLNDEATATWYVRPPSGGQYGPADNKLLANWIEEGRVATNALLWRDGWVQWREASEVLAEVVDRLPQVHETVLAADASGAANGGSAAAVSDSSGLSPEHTSPSDASLHGGADVGTNRRNRSMQRLLLITILATLALLLIAVLVYVIQRNGTDADAEVAARALEAITRLSS